MVINGKNNHLFGIPMGGWLALFPMITSTFAPGLIPLTRTSCLILIVCGFAHIAFTEGNFYFLKRRFRDIGRILNLKKVVKNLSSGDAYISADGDAWYDSTSYFTGNNKIKLMKKTHRYKKHRLIGYNAEGFCLLDKEYKNVFSALNKKINKPLLFYESGIVSKAIDLRIKKESDLCAVMI